MNARVYYNEIDAFAAAWLRSLIADGFLPDGDVDERDIRDVLPSDLDGYAQGHFFAGIGGWAYALDLAGWPRDRPVWTGSCPCQPFSAAGRRGGTADERHLWPAFFHLIGECRPATLFGEQVASKDGLAWLDLVHADLEGAGYAVGAADLCAAGVGAPHIRQRLWFVADAASGRTSANEQSRQLRRLEQSCSIGRLGNVFGPRLEGRDARAVGYERAAAERAGAACAVAHRMRDGLEGSEPVGATDRGRRPAHASCSPWSDLEWLPCRDGKSRPTQRRFQSVADGIWPSMVGRSEAYLSPLTTNQRNRVGILRGAGNAIVPQVAAEFIQAVMEAL